MLLYQLWEHTIFFWGSCLSNKSWSYLWVASILKQFWIILSPNKSWRKIFFFSCQRHCDQGLTVVIVYYFQIWNNPPKKHNIIISWVISSHMGPMYIETPSTFLPLMSLSWVVIIVLVCGLEIRTASIRLFPMLAITGALRSFFCVPHCKLFLFFLTFQVVFFFFNISCFDFWGPKYFLKVSWYVWISYCWMMFYANRSSVFRELLSNLYIYIYIYHISWHIRRASFTKNIF